MTVKAPADRRFRRIQQPRRTQRRGIRPVRWVRGLRRVLLASSLVYASYAGVDLLSRAPIFQIDEVVVRGNERLSAGEITMLLEDLRGESLPRVDLETWRQRLEASTWVATAAIRRILPSTIEVAITERVPMGVGRIEGALYLVDRDGMIIDEFGPHYSDLDLPVIDGLALDSADGSRAVDPGRAGLAARLLDQLRHRGDLARRVSQIDVADRRDAVVILEGDPARVHLGEGRFAERLQSYLELAPTLRARVPQMDYVDLRLDDRVYVRPAATRPRAVSAAPPGGMGQTSRGAAPDAVAPRSEE